MWSEFVSRRQAVVYAAMNYRVTYTGGMWQAWGRGQVMHGFGGETLGKQTTWKTLSQVGR